MTPRARYTSPAAAMQRFALVLGGGEKLLDDMTDAELDSWARLSAQLATRRRAVQDRRVDRQRLVVECVVMGLVILLALFPLLWVGVR